MSYTYPYPTTTTSTSHTDPTSSPSVATTPLSSVQCAHNTALQPPNIFTYHTACNQSFSSTCITPHNATIMSAYNEPKRSNHRTKCRSYVFSIPATDVTS